MNIEKKIKELEKRIEQLERPLRLINTINPIKRILPTKYKKEFEQFWNSYPHRYGRKVNRKSALRTFMHSDIEDIKQILIAVENFASMSIPDSGFVQDASRWLSEENWRVYINELNN